MAREREREESWSSWFGLEHIYIQRDWYWLSFDYMPVKYVSALVLSLGMDAGGRHKLAYGWSVVVRMLAAEGNLQH